MQNGSLHRNESVNCLLANEFPAAAAAIVVVFLYSFIASLEFCEWCLIYKSIKNCKHFRIEVVVILKIISSDC